MGKSGRKVSRASGVRVECRLTKNGSLTVTGALRLLERAWGGGAAPVGFILHFCKTAHEHDSSPTFYRLTPIRLGFVYSTL